MLDLINTIFSAVIVVFVVTGISAFIASFATQTSRGFAIFMAVCYLWAAYRYIDVGERSLAAAFVTLLLLVIATLPDEEPKGRRVA